MVFSASVALPAQELVWARDAGGPTTTGALDFAYDMAVDASGNSYVVGCFGGAGTFGLGDPNQTVLNAAGSSDVFVAKYDAAGRLAWAKRAGSPLGAFASDAGFGIAADAAGDCYVTGASTAPRRSGPASSIRPRWSPPAPAPTTSSSPSLRPTASCSGPRAPEGLPAANRGETSRSMPRAASTSPAPSSGR